MNVTPRRTRRRPGTVRALVLGVCAAGALGLSGCSGDGGGEAADGDTKASATATSGTHDGEGKESAGTTGTPAPKASATPDDDTEKSGADSDASSKATGSTDSDAGTGTGTGSDDAGADCDHKMPISPDEIAVYRHTPEGGSLSLIVKHGNWGCGTPDSDGAPFETVGKETYIPMDQAAAITVTTPIVESTTNQPIGVQEFLDWLEAHPNAGLVFTYHLGDNGAIDRLDEVFTP